MRAISRSLALSSTLVLASLVCESHGRRTRRRGTAQDQAQDQDVLRLSADISGSQLMGAVHQSNSWAHGSTSHAAHPMKGLAALLLELSAVAAFNPSASGQSPFMEKAAHSNSAPAVWKRLYNEVSDSTGLKRTRTLRLQVARSNRTLLDDLVVGKEVEGTIISLQPYGAFVDIGAEENGLLHVSEISREPVRNISEKFSVGQLIKCRINSIEKKKRRFSLMGLDFFPLAVFKAGTEVEGKVANVNSFGAFVDIGSSREALLRVPDSDEPLENLVVGQDIKCRIKSFDVEKNSVFLTTRQLTPVEEFKIGTEVEATVLRVMPYGAFMDIGSTIDALLPVGKISNEPIQTADEKLSVGDVVKCRIKEVNLQKQQIQLTCKEAIALSEFEVGSEVEGRVTVVKPFGAFIDIGAYKDALLSVNEIPDQNIAGLFSIGDSVKCQIKAIDLEQKRVSVGFSDDVSSIKDIASKKQIHLTEAEKRPVTDFKVGSDVEGNVVNLAPIGAFVDIGTSTAAFLPSNKIKDVAENVSLGQTVQCCIQEIDLEKKQITLTSRGRKTLDQVEVGSEIEGTVASIVPFGTFIDIGALKDGLLHVSETSQESAQKFSVGETVKVRVKEIDWENTKISLTRTPEVPNTVIGELAIGSKVKGEVTNVVPFGVFVDIGAGSDALLHLSDMSNDPMEDVTEKFAVGDTVNCRIKYIDPKQNRIGLTYRDLGTQLEDLQIGSEVEGKVVRVMPFGAFVDIGASDDALLPYSELVREPLRDFTDVAKNFSVGDNIKCKIQEVSVEKRRITLTCRGGMPLDMLEVGSEVEGTVRRLLSYGAFVDFGATKDGLLHMADLSDEPISQVSDKLSEGDVVKCRIKDVDVENNKVSLTCKEKSQLGEEADFSISKMPLEQLQLDTEVEGKVTMLTPFGAFIDIGATKDGLLHLSEASNEPLEDITQKFSIGDSVKCRIKDVNLKAEQLSLSCKDIELERGKIRTEDFEVGSEVYGKVLRLVPYGAFLDIGASTDALLHKEDMSAQLSETISDKLFSGEVVKCRVKNVNAEKQQISLICADARTPFDELEVGAEVEGKVLRLTPFGAFVDIGALTDALLHVSDSSEEPIEDIAEKFAVGDTIKCLIKRVNVEERQIGLTCKDMWKTLGEPQVALDAEADGLPAQAAQADDARTPLQDFQIGSEVEGKVTGVVPFGAFIDVGAVRDGLLHVSEASKEPLEDMTEKFSVGDIVKCHIKAIDLEEEKISLTSKDGWAPLEQFEVGAEVEGKISGLVSSGAFIDIGAMRDAMLLMSEIPEEKVDDITEKFSSGESVKCRVKDINVKKQLIMLTCKDDLTPLEELQVGMEVEGTVTTLVPFGAFMDIGATGSSLLHVSDISDGPVEDIEEFFSVGDTVKCWIKHIDLEERQVSLTSKNRMIPLEELKVGSEVDGKIRRLEPYGAFVDIGAVTDGFLHISKISAEPIEDITQKFFVGEAVKCRINEIDFEEEQIKLTLKARTSFDELRVGAEVEGTVVNCSSFGAFIDIGAETDAALHESMSSAQPIKDISQEFSVGQVVKCRIQHIDTDKKLVKVMRKDAKTPLHELRVGAAIEGKIISFSSFGAFVDIGASKDALLPVSEISKKQNKNLTESFSLGESITGWILDINLKEGRLSITCRDDRIFMEELRIGTPVQGQIVSVAPFGAFVDIGASTNALLPKAQMSSEILQDIAENRSLFERATYYIRKIDLENRQIEVTCRKGKTLNELEVGSEVEGKILSLVPFGAFVDIGAYTSALLHVSEISDEVIRDITEKFSVGDSVKCRVKLVDLQNNQLTLTCKENKIPLEELELDALVEGNVTRLVPFGAFVDIGAVKHGLLHLEDASEEPLENITDKFSLGDPVKCRIKRINLQDQQISLTCRDMRVHSEELEVGVEAINLEEEKLSPNDSDDWMPLEQFEVGAEVEGKVTRLESVGAFIDVGAMIEGVLPVSEISQERIDEIAEKFASGESVKCQIKDINAKEQQILLTCKEGMMPLEELQIGMEVEGTVVSLETIGAFLDIGASETALLHVSSDAEKRIIDIAQELSVGDSIKCRIRSIDLENRQISVSRKSDPTLEEPEVDSEVEGKIDISSNDLKNNEVSATRRESLEELEVGNEVSGRVTNLVPFGAFVDIGATSDGLLHVSDISDDPDVGLLVTQKLSVGDTVKCRIKSINIKQQRLSLTRKDLGTSLEELQVGSKVEGEVVKLSPFGAFIDIGAGEDALLHISDISNERTEDIAQKFSIGDKVKCRIKNVNVKQRKISLDFKDPGKQLDELQVGNEVEGKVVNLATFGVFVDFGATCNGLLHISDFPNKPEDIGKQFSVGDSVRCWIKDILAKERKISLTCRADKIPIEDFDGSNKVMGKVEKLVPLEELEVGSEVEGKVRASVSFGFFLDIGAGTDALLHVDDISNNATENTALKFSSGDTVKCRIKYVDLERKRISLTGRDLGIPLEKLQVGGEVEGKVRRAMPYGAVVDIGASQDALLHNSDMSDELATNNVSAGDTIKCWIKDIALKQKKIFVTCKADGISLVDFGIGDKVVGRVRKLAAYGVFVDIGAPTDALLHVEDMPHYLTKDLTRYFSVGDNVRCRIKDVVLGRIKFRLSCPDELVD